MDFMVMVAIFCRILCFLSSLYKVNGNGKEGHYSICDNGNKQKCTGSKYNGFKRFRPYSLKT